MKSWKTGAIIAILLGLNVIQGAVLTGLFIKSRLARHDSAPIALSDEKIAQMPPETRAAVKTSLAEARPVLRARLAEVRKARLDLKQYISSPHYNRAEAQKRFEALREKSNQAQIVAQEMLLNAADQMAPEDRADVTQAISENDASN
ncbi:MAG: periplasmic heavy metal sensor [Asticcacaulis sp.]|uniref:periplasmic heavy metal sensor n=1 Tax=Asticcacaulis sp. TaxID=1872648 RepID=UPI0039E2ADBB